MKHILYCTSKGCHRWESLIVLLFWNYINKVVGRVTEYIRTWHSNVLVAKVWPWSVPCGLGTRLAQERTKFGLHGFWISTLGVAKLITAPSRSRVHNRVDIVHPPCCWTVKIFSSPVLTNVSTYVNYWVHPNCAINTCKDIDYHPTSVMKCTQSSLIPRPTLRNVERDLVILWKRFCCQQSWFWIDESCSSITNYYVVIKLFNTWKHFSCFIKL